MRKSAPGPVLSEVEGFTLVELLVVIAIIAILAAVGLTVFSNVSKSARDSKRKADLNAIMLALELHYAQYGSYTQPETMCSDTSYGGWGGCGAVSGTGDWDLNSDLRDLITEGYMRDLPKDPINSTEYYYWYEPSSQNEQYAGQPAGETYQLCALKLETTSTSYCAHKYY